MWIVQAVRQYLDKQGIRYELLTVPPFASLVEAEAAARLVPGSLVQAVLMRDQYGLIMAVVPASSSLNAAVVRTLLKRDLQRIPAEDQRKLLKGVNPEFTPPIGDAYGVKVVVDDEIAMLAEVYLSAGDNSHLIRMDAPNFHLLQRNATFTQGISIPGAAPSAAPESAAPSPADMRRRLEQRLEQLDLLPPMPDMAQRILQLNANPYAHVGDLAEVVALDPSLAAQLIRYASSPFYGFGAKIDSIKTAIRVLGYDMVMHLALGVATSKAFKIDKEGRLGLRCYWRHALHSALLTQRLGKELPRELRPGAGLSYLAGLLHNFGQILLGHLFRDEFAELNRRLAQDSTASLHQMELELLGFYHAQLGALLLEQWGLPDEVVVASREHANSGYHGIHANYARLVYVVDQLLAQSGIGVATPDAEGMGVVLKALQLPGDKTAAALAQLLKDDETLNGLAQHFVS